MARSFVRRAARACLRRAGVRGLESLAHLWCRCRCPVAAVARLCLSESGRHAYRITIAKLALSTKKLILGRGQPAAYARGAGPSQRLTHWVSSLGTALLLSGAEQLQLSPPPSLQRRLTGGPKGAGPCRSAHLFDHLLVLTHNLGQSLVNESVGDPEVSSDELYTAEQLQILLGAAD